MEEGEQTQVEQTVEHVKDVTGGTAPPAHPLEAPLAELESLVLKLIKHNCLLTDSDRV
jgi:hypothetical protein